MDAPVIDLEDAIDKLGATATSLIDGIAAQRDEALARVEELEEIIHDLVMNENEQDAVGVWSGRAEVFAKAWARAAEAVGLDDGGEP